MMNSLRSIFELSTAEAYELATNQLGHELPPLDAVENEDWGRDMVLQALASHSDGELKALRLHRQPEHSNQ